MNMRNPVGGLYGLAARYERKQDLLSAVRLAKRKGYQRMETYSPFEIDELNEVMDYKENTLPWVVFIAGLTGGITGFFMQYAANVWFLPLNVGGRPYNSWPAFVPITFELTILFAAIAGFLGVIIRCGLPQIYHPMFNAAEFERASLDSFFLCITSDDPGFDRNKVQSFLQETNPKEIKTIEN